VHPVRRRRLFSDLAAVQALIASSENLISLQSATGNPPESYVFIFRCRSLSALTSSGPVFTDQHHVRIHCSAAYPAQPPFASMLTPVVHPHIWPNRLLCLGTWKPHEKLDSLLQRIGAILAYDPAAINWRSVADDDAATWARNHQHLFPLDSYFSSIVASASGRATL
jgi:ubiquitin-protein ligase